jgi:hypothetical protein
MTSTLPSSHLSTPLSFIPAPFYPASPHVISGSPSTLNGLHPPLPDDQWLQEAIEKIYSDHRLPSALQTMEETDRMSLAYAHEVCNTVQDEVNIAERRYRQMLLQTRVYHLHFLQARDRLQELRKQLQVIVDVALQDTSGQVSPPNSDDGCEQESAPRQFTTISAMACTNIRHIAMWYDRLSTVA